MNKTIEINIPSCQELYDSLPDECKENYVKLYLDYTFTLSMHQALHFHYSKIIAIMINECKDAIKPVIYMSTFSQDDYHQKICNWSASDQNKTQKNTNQCLYAGYLLYDMEDNTFLIHT